MGVDKALLLVDGIPMAVRVASVLADAGATQVLAVGGDVAALQAAGLDARPDPRQGDGPLAGLLEAFALATEPVAVVVACDLPWLGRGTIQAIVGTLLASQAAVAVARTGRREPLCAAWRVAAVREPVGAAFAAGERAVHAVLAGLAVVEVPVEAGDLRNVNRPEDLDVR
jgi:molybdopterin-guanine dinucleotide biosynthesis protein A